jgi:hypothetical protein
MRRQHRLVHHVLRPVHCCRTCPVPIPIFYLNQSRLVVTYAEFKRIYAAVLPSLGTSNAGD